MAQPGDSTASPSGSGARLPRILTLIALSILLVAALVGVDLLVLSRNNPAQALSPHYYMALGDSLSFGYQPNLDFSSGFADDIFNDLRKANVTGIVNYACAGETTDTMIHGGCVGRFAHHGSYTGAQLQAAIDFLTSRAQPGQSQPHHAGDRLERCAARLGSDDMRRRSQCGRRPRADGQQPDTGDPAAVARGARSAYERGQWRPAPAELLQPLRQRVPSIRAICQ